MPDSPILRALVVPMALILVFFTFARACASSMKKTRAAEFAAANPEAAAAPSGAGMPSAAKAPRKFDEIEYPPGLTEGQVSYHVSVNSEFAEPMTSTAAKNGWGDGSQALRRLGYIESDGSAGFTLSRDGLMKLRILSETPEAWTFYVTQRVFDRVSSIQMLPDGNARVTISWHWEATDLAKNMGIRDTPHGAVAEFRSNENAWTFYKWASSLKGGY